MLIDRLARDSRKFNVRALFASQLAGDLLRVSGFASLVNAVFVGRTDDDEAQAEALRLLRVPTGVGYEQMLGTLSPRPRHDDRPDDTPRQFVFADGHGGVEKIRIDLEAPHLEHVREALDTNPDASRVAVRGVPAATRPRCGPRTSRRRSPVPAGARTAGGAGRGGRAARNGAARRRRAPLTDGRPSCSTTTELDLLDDLDDPAVDARRRRRSAARIGDDGSDACRRTSAPATTGSAAGPCGDPPGLPAGPGGCRPLVLAAAVDALRARRRAARPPRTGPRPRRRSRCWSSSGWSAARCCSARPRSRSR